MDLRSLPKVDSLSRVPELAAFPERVRVAAARKVIDGMREQLVSGKGLNGQTAAELAMVEAQRISEPSLRLAINLSGVILHTGIGRARLAKAAVEQIALVAANHSFVELDPESGKRGDRQSHVRELLIELTGAEEAFVVNNAAAALVLVLRALAKDKEVILSRGQMVEIGGSFRMPEIVAESGCRLVEVGCTNKTRLNDYEKAITPETGAILRCHTSNFKIVGFTEQPALTDLVKTTNAHKIPCVDDMGTGCLIDLGTLKIPTIQDSIQAGADVVTASGDKLLGGPQAGLILGKKEALEKIKRHPLARAFRIDKLTLAGLEATLKLYSEGRESEIPTIAYLRRSREVVKTLAIRLASSCLAATIAEGVTEVGGGSGPGIEVPTWRVGLPTFNPNDLSRRLRHSNPPIMARIEDGLVWLDPRTLDEEEVESVCMVLKSL